MAKAKQLDYKGRSPISGWGVRWNVDADYLKRLSDARDVSNITTIFLIFKLSFLQLSHLD